MKLLFGTVVAFGLVSIISGLQCLKCTNKYSMISCDMTAKIETCMGGFQSCETVVRRENGRTVIAKGCKQTNACKNNHKQFTQGFGQTTQCNQNQLSSLCTCCCETDNCNRGGLDCLPKRDPIVPVPDIALYATKCPVLKSPSNGQVSCDDNNEVGSTCTFECSGDHQVSPAGNSLVTCSSDGTWTAPAPCCIRPCPPFLTMDAVIMYHLKYPKSMKTLMEIRERVLGQLHIGPESSKFAGFYFTNETIHETLYSFNEYVDNKQKLLNLIEERLSNIPADQDDVPVNTADALWYSVNYMFKEDMGARPDVPKITVLCTDVNSDQNVKFLASAAGALRRDGVLTYVLAIEQQKTSFDDEQLMAIAGKREHVFKIDGESPDFSAFMDDLALHFCDQTCDNA